MLFPELAFVTLAMSLNRFVIMRVLTLMKRGDAMTATTTMRMMVIMTMMMTTKLLLPMGDDHTTKHDNAHVECDGRTKPAKPWIKVLRQ